MYIILYTYLKEVHIQRYPVYTRTWLITVNILFIKIMIWNFQTI